MNQQTIEAAAPATPKPMPRIRVNAGYLRLAATCAAQKDIRYYLQGIRIEPRKEGGAYLVATNGHHLIAIIDPLAECSEATIISPNKATLAACPKADPHSRGVAEARTIEVEGETALAISDNNGLLRHIQPRDVVIEGGNFPQWRRVLPAFEKLKLGQPQCINPIYRNAPLAAIAHGKFISIDGFQVSDDAHGPLVQRLCRMDNVVHIIMPCRGDSTVTQWAHLWKTAKA